MPAVRADGFEAVAMLKPIITDRIPPSEGLTTLAIPLSVERHREWRFRSDVPESSRQHNRAGDGTDSVSWQSHWREHWWERACLPFSYGHVVSRAHGRRGSSFEGHAEEQASARENRSAQGCTSRCPDGRSATSRGKHSDPVVPDDRSKHSGHRPRGHVNDIAPRRTPRAAETPAGLGARTDH
jgi:hypothetical protein